MTHIVTHATRAAAVALIACACTAGDDGVPQRDPRQIKLEAFFQTYDCPTPHHVDDYLRAADDHQIDYRLLPAISLVESTCGSFGRHNNRWGWDSAQHGFASVSDGIEFIASQLAESPYYKGKTLEQKLLTYNPYPRYVEQVRRLMDQIEN
jgi:hypothetical protein